jgi:hypothetical protein
MACPNIFNAVTYLRSDAYADKRFKLLTLSPGLGDYARIPVKGHDWCGGIMVDYDVDSYITMRFPVAHMDTVKKELCNHIFHPGFRYHAGDLWLAYFMGINGENGVQYEEANIKPYIRLVDNRWEQSDGKFYHTLVAKHKAGYHAYV